MIVCPIIYNENKKGKCKQSFEYSSAKWMISSNLPHIYGSIKILLKTGDIIDYYYIKILFTSQHLSDNRSWSTMLSILFPWSYVSWYILVNCEFGSKKATSDKIYSQQTFESWRFPFAGTLYKLNNSSTDECKFPDISILAEVSFSSTIKK